MVSLVMALEIDLPFYLKENTNDNEPFESKKDLLGLVSYINLRCPNQAKQPWKKNCTLPRHVNIACIDVQRTMRNGCELVQYPVEVEVMSKGLLGYLGLFGNLFEEHRFRVERLQNSYLLFVVIFCGGICFVI